MRVVNIMQGRNVLLIVVSVETTSGCYICSGPCSDEKVYSLS